MSLDDKVSHYIQPDQVALRNLNARGARRNTGTGIKVGAVVAAREVIRMVR